MACSAKINVNGEDYQCELENGPNHNPQHSFNHKARIPDGERQWLLVEWGYARLVTPPRVG